MTITTAQALSASVTRVRTEIERLKRFYPEITEDLELFAGTVSGETDFDELLDAILEQFLERVAMRDALSLRIDTMKERAARFDKGAEAFRAIAFDLMKAADKTMVRRPLATLVVSKGRDVLELDGDFNAQGYMRVRSEPMKSDILAALKAGNEIPGARLVKSDDALSVRTK